MKLPKSVHLIFDEDEVILFYLFFDVCEEELQYSLKENQDLYLTTEEFKKELK